MTKEDKNKDLKEFCKTEGIDFKALDNRQIKLIEKSFLYKAYIVNKNVKELLDLLAKAINKK